MAIGSIGARLDLTVRQGADFKVRMTFRNADNSLLDLTGVTPRAQLRDSYTSVDATNFVIAVAPDPTQGWVDLSLTNAATAALTCGPTETSSKSLKLWDLEFLDSAGKVSAILYGEVRVFREITKNA